MAFDDGGRAVRIIASSTSFYENYNTTNLYVERVFGGGCGSITVSNDHASDPVQLSFDGATLDGELAGQESITLNVKSRTSIFVKSTAGDATARIWGW
jgi:hypothetical protein